MYPNCRIDNVVELAAEVTTPSIEVFANASELTFERRRKYGFTFVEAFHASDRGEHEVSRTYAECRAYAPPKGSSRSIVEMLLLLFDASQLRTVGGFLHITRRER